MARGTGMQDGQQVFRAVVEFSTGMRGNPVLRHVCGPYDKKGTAAGVATQKSRPFVRRGNFVDKYVEASVVKWERVS